MWIIVCDAERSQKCQLFVQGQESQESSDSDSSDSDDSDDRSDSNDNIEGGDTVCAIGTGGNSLTGYISYGSGTNDTCLPVAANRSKWSTLVTLGTRTKLQCS